MAHVFGVSNVAPEDLFVATNGRVSLVAYARGPATDAPPPGDALPRQPSPRLGSRDTCRRLLGGLGGAARASRVLDAMSHAGALFGALRRPAAGVLPLLCAAVPLGLRGAAGDLADARARLALGATDRCVRGVAWHGAVWMWRAWLPRACAHARGPLVYREALNSFSTAFRRLLWLED